MMTSHVHSTSPGAHGAFGLKCVQHSQKVPLKAGDVNEIDAGEAYGAMRQSVLNLIPVYW